MASPKVSVIVPTYKTAKYLPRCLDSILSQTFQDYEIIVVSDSDEDSKIAEAYALKDARIKIIKDVRKGLGGARNAGLEIAQGEYIYFVDGDDWIEPSLLENVINSFNDNIDLVVFDNYIIVEKGAKKQKGISKYTNLKYSGFKEIDYETIFKTNVYCWNKVFRKSIIDNFGIKFPESMQYEDFPFYYAYMINAKNVFFLNQRLYNYLQRTNSGMNKTFEGNFELVKDHLTALKFLHTYLKNSYDEYFARIFTEITYSALRFLRNNNDKIKYLQDAENLYRELNIKNFNIATLKFLEQENYIKIINKVEIEYNTKFLKIVKTTNNKLKFYIFKNFFIMSLKIER